MRTPSPCGTVAAYKRHKRRGEDPCEPCMQANRDRSAEIRAQKRVPDVPVPVPPTPVASNGGHLTTVEELTWHLEMLRAAIAWAGENDPGKMPQLAKERRETLKELQQLAESDESEGGGLNEFFTDQPLSIVRGAETEARESA